MGKPTSIKISEHREGADIRESLQVNTKEGSITACFNAYKFVDKDSRQIVV